jgi:hypothetical protein
MAKGFKGGDSGAEATERSHDVTFAKGGNTHMFGEQAAGEQTPAETGKTQDSAPGDKFASGGKSKMFGYQGSVAARSGITSAR